MPGPGQLRHLEREQAKIMYTLYKSPAHLLVYVRVYGIEKLPDVGAYCIDTQTVLHIYMLELF